MHRGDIKRLGELRQLMDSFGITPKGQMDRRWEAPKPPRPGWSSGQQQGARFAHLRDPRDPRYRPSVKERFGTDGHRPSAKERVADVMELERETASERFERLQAEERRRRLGVLER